MSTSDNSQRPPPDTVREIIPRPSAVPKQDATSGKREEDSLVAQARELGSLGSAELQHFYLERYREYLIRHLEIVRKERDKAEEECHRLRGGEIGKWFQLIGGLFMVTGALLTRKTDYEYAGWVALVAGAFVQVSALVVPSLVYRTRGRKNPN